MGSGNGTVRIARIYSASSEYYVPSPTSLVDLIAVVGTRHIYSISQSSHLRNETWRQAGGTTR